MNIFINSAFHLYYQRHPLKLIDVGARGGLKRNWKKAKKYLQIIGFEPDVQSFQYLKKNSSANELFVNMALYKDKGVLDFYLTRGQGQSSIFMPKYSFLKHFPESERFDILETSKVVVDTLDNQLKQNNISDVDFLKVDTQGSELLVLEGATKTLSNLFGLEVEVEFCQLYEGQPLFADIDNFLRNFGFQLFDLRKSYWKRENGKNYGGLKGQIIFADAIYFLDLSHLKGTLNFIKDSTLRKSKILKSISIAILYGYVDYAIEIFEQEKFIFSQEEIKIFYKAIKKNVRISTKIPHFRGRRRIARLFKILYNIFNYNYHGWLRAEEFLGNLE